MEVAVACTWLARKGRSRQPQPILNRNQKTYKMEYEENTHECTDACSTNLHNCHGEGLWCCKTWLEEEERVVKANEEMRIKNDIQKRETDGIQ